jgi:hypothetical protein
MKIIFLDFDGVLNSEKWYRSRSKTVDQHDVSSQYPFYEIDPHAVYLLNKIVKETDSKIVVSSTWRLGRSIEELTEILKHHNFEGEIIDKTPHFGAPTRFDGVEKPGYTIPRGCEIDWWLDQKGFQRINWSIEKQREYIQKSEVKNYIILDDDSDMLYNQREHFVKTFWTTGLDESKTEEAIRILNTPLEELYYRVDGPYYDENQLSNL